MAGASGLVGQQVLAELLNDSRYNQVHVLVRRPLAQTHPKLLQHVVSFDNLPALPRIDHAWIALGTTIKQAGSQAAFRRVDFDAVVASAQAALKAGATRLGVVSALGANPQSGVFYNRVKGEAEQALEQMGWPTLVIARPSLLLGDREALGQIARPGEKIGAALGRVIGGLLPARLRPISAYKVANALVSAVANSAQAGVQIMESNALQAKP